jgi:transcriptional repressor NrdR
MKCPHCGHTVTKVIDSQSVEGGTRRHRECEGCEQRFITCEQVQRTTVMVIKRDGRREEFKRDKLLSGLRACARKRPLPAESIVSIADDIERRLAGSGRSEVPSRVVGEMAIAHLKRLDPIAYIRFASAYQQFISLDDMLSDLAQLAHSPMPPAEQARLFEDDFDRMLSGEQPPAEDGDLPRPPTPIESVRAARSV